MQQASRAKDVSSSRTPTRDVFVVHGHDTAARESVARFLARLGLNPIILHEQANEGRTIIEKFEAHADASFAVVLLTPDDEGKAKNVTALQPRARQNVVLELGYFIGRLGRKNVCPIYVEGVELPSDVTGLVYVPYDAADLGWQLSLARELKAAGIPADYSKVI